MRVLVVSVGVVARAWLMAKEFRPVRRDQVFLMPPDMREWLPCDHLVWFILDTLEALGKRIYAGLENPGVDRVTTRASS